jgi:peptidoglycan hydrolase CwlO-like protein
MRLRFPSVLALAVACALASGAAAAAEKPVAKSASKSPDAVQQALLNQLAEAQKWLGEQVWHIKAEVEALPSQIAEVKDGHTATQEQIDKLRDEVKGLYVEISDVKERIESLKEDVGGVDSNVYRFRTYAGFFLALVLIMVAFMFVATLRR